MNRLGCSLHAITITELIKILNAQQGKNDNEHSSSDEDEGQNHQNKNKKVKQQNEETIYPTRLTDCCPHFNHNHIQKNQGNWFLWLAAAAAASSSQ